MFIDLKDCREALSEVVTRTPFSAGFDYGKSIRAAGKGSGMCFKPIRACPRSGHLSAAPRHSKFSRVNRRGLSKTSPHLAQPRDPSNNMVRIAAFRENARPEFRNRGQSD